ncbi:hypothetical protein EG328_009120 [Venturia inaequalis]|uniref:Uncharacterized protein n=1 Tax=Venturia inaequalis TaxID=5025 RepID=A0A8H3UA57_VENIN|nr:hypothetical protein EG328_009120 [Venturia inaequalis]RDI86453.1 hypothetical protein Vi05172_g3600 [Venturia inaequalis]
MAGQTTHTPPDPSPKRFPPTFLNLPPELRQYILLQTHSITTYPIFPSHPSIHPLGLSFFEIHAHYYITSTLKWAAALREVFDALNEDMDFVQKAWVKGLIPVANDAERDNREAIDEERTRDVTMVEGVEMDAQLAEIVRPLMRMGLEECGS